MPSPSSSEALNKDLLIEQVLLLRDLNRREEALQVLLSHPEILDLEMQQLQLKLLWELGFGKLSEKPCRCHLR